MKLGPLKSAIRDLQQAPRALFRIHPDVVLEVHLQKTPLLASLDTAFPNGRASETGLTINAEGFLTRE